MSCSHLSRSSEVWSFLNKIAADSPYGASVRNLSDSSMYVQSVTSVFAQLYPLFRFQLKEGFSPR